jgi:hypothetical protein
MQYLGQVHGYHASLVNPESLGTANQLLLDAADVGSELFGLAKDAGKKADFCKAGGRLHNWLKHLNGVISRLLCKNGVISRISQAASSLLLIPLPLLSRPIQKLPGHI